MIFREQLTECYLAQLKSKTHGNVVVVFWLYFTVSLKTPNEKEKISHTCPMDHIIYSSMIWKNLKRAL